VPPEYRAGGRLYLKVFFAAAAKPPDQVAPAGVLAFITAQRTAQAGERGRAARPRVAGRRVRGVSWKGR
jgi:hypothetical protein